MSCRRLVPRNYLHSNTDYIGLRHLAMLLWFSYQTIIAIVLLNLLIGKSYKCKLLHIHEFRTKSFPVCIVLISFYAHSQMNIFPFFKLCPLDFRSNGLSASRLRQTCKAVHNLYFFFFYLFTSPIMIALMNATINSIQSNKMKQWKFARTSIWLQYFHR